MKKQNMFLRVLPALLVFVLALAGCPDGNDEDPPLTGSISISPFALVELPISVDTENLDGTGNINYEWQLGDSETGSFTVIDNAAGVSYTPVAEDEDKYLRVEVTRAGFSGSIISIAYIIFPAGFNDEIYKGPTLNLSENVNKHIDLGITNLTISDGGLGGSGSVVSGTLSYTVSTPDTASQTDFKTALNKVLAFYLKDNADNLFNNIKINPVNAKFAVLINFKTPGNKNLYKASYYAETVMHRTWYIYTDRNVTITATGKNFNGKDLEPGYYSYRTANMDMKLVAGWNAMILDYDVPLNYSTTIPYRIYPGIHEENILWRYD
jgi:hypothetical protein